MAAGPPAPQSGGRLWRSGLFWRMMSGALIGALALIITAVVSFAVISELLAETGRVTTAESGAANVQQFASSLESAFATFDLLGDTTFQPRLYTVQRAALLRARGQLAVAAFPPPVQSRVSDILSRFDTLEPELQALNDRAARDRPGAAAGWQATDRDRVRRLSQDTQDLGAALKADTTAGLRGMRTLQNTAQLAIPLIGTLGLLLGIFIAALATRRTVQRIGQVNRDLARMAEGDLTLPLQPIPPARPASMVVDEVESLERSYVKTLDKLREPLARIQLDASRISASSTEISTAATYQAVSSNQQATAITEVTVTVEQLNQTAVQIAEAAASVATAADQALVSAGRGQDAVRDSIIGMAMIRSRVNDITARILALSAQSQRISEIIDVIDTMAAQTHILALNAAVESAGAGDPVAGERFGVVASEVKKLAQRSAAATREVRTVIAQVQAATNAAVMATEDGLKETEKGVRVAHQSGDANEDIIGMVERTAQLANAISLATQQQRTASEQVVATMREVAQGTRQAAAGSQQASRAAGELSDIAHELHAVSEGFQIDRPVPPVPRPGHGGPALQAVSAEGIA